MGNPIYFNFSLWNTVYLIRRYAPRAPWSVCLSSVFFCVSSKSIIVFQNICIMEQFPPFSMFVKGFAIAATSTTKYLGMQKIYLNQQFFQLPVSLNSFNFRVALCTYFGYFKP